MCQLSRCLRQVLVIVVADVAALATVANKITIEKDWVVVMAQGDKDTLACEFRSSVCLSACRGGGGGSGGVGSVISGLAKHW